MDPLQFEKKTNWSKLLTMVRTISYSKLMVSLISFDQFGQPLGELKVCDWTQIKFEKKLVETVDQGSCHTGRKIAVVVYKFLPIWSFF